MGTPVHSPSLLPPIPAWVTNASACSRIDSWGTQECTSTLSGTRPSSSGSTYFPIWSTTCQPARSPYASRQRR